VLFILHHSLNYDLCCSLARYAVFYVLVATEVLQFMKINPPSLGIKFSTMNTDSTLELKLSPVLKFKPSLPYLNPIFILCHLSFLSKIARWDLSVSTYISYTTEIAPNGIATRMLVIFFALLHY
jgi:hypothetical protein